MSPHSVSSTGFAHYLRGGSLPCQRADVRRVGDTGATLALVQHAPTSGIEYPAVDDLIVSVVWRSAQAPVVRDVGQGEQHFTDDAGKVLLTPPGCASYWRFESEPTVLHLSVSPLRAAKLLQLERDELAENLHRLSGQPLHIPLLSRWAAQLWQLSAHSPPAPRQRHRTSLRPDWRRLFNLLLEANSAPGSPGATLSSERLQTVLTAIEQNPQTSPGSLAQLVGLSVDHFSRAFRLSTGYTPHQMISHCRIEAAKRRLQEPQISLTELAIDLGFSSSAHFSSRFRQLTGFAPSEWRARFIQ